MHYMHFSYLKNIFFKILFQKDFLYFFLVTNELALKIENAANFSKIGIPT